MTDRAGNSRGCQVVEKAAKFRRLWSAVAGGKGADTALETGEYNFPAQDHPALKSNGPVATTVQRTPSVNIEHPTGVGFVSPGQRPG
jgi:hypothetical protein